MDDRDVVDRLEAIRRELQEQEGLRKEEQKAYHEQDRLLRQWAEWKRLRESYYSAQRFYSQVSKAKEQARKLAEELKQVEQEKQSYSWGPSLPGETGELITELQALQEQRTKLLKRIQELEAQISASIEKEPVSEEEGVSDRLDWGVFGPHPVTVLKRLVSGGGSPNRLGIYSKSGGWWECRTTLERFALFNRADQATLKR